MVVETGRDKENKIYTRAGEVELPQRMDVFLRHHRKTGGRRSDYTLLRRHFYFFCEYLGERDLDFIDHGEAQGFVSWLNEHYGDYSAGYQQNILKSIKRLYRYHCEKRTLLRNPFQYVKGPKVKRILPREIPLDKDVRALLQVIPMEAERDRALIELLYGSGLRISELIALGLDDIDLSEGWLRITDAKSGMDRNVPISSICQMALSAYIKGERQKLLLSQPDYRRMKEHRAVDTNRLFIKPGGFPMCQWSITSLLSLYTSKAGIRKHLTAHSFRHACAREMLKGRASIRYVQKMLGHNDISSTMIYTRLSAHEVQQALEVFHPRGKGHAHVE